MDNKPLHGIRVIEVGQLLAGPFAGTLLAYFGADVIKVEPPGDGDPIRGWRLLDKDGTSFWWRSLGRNKKSLTLNLRTTEGRDVLGKLLGDADVLIENFKPGTMEKWGLGPEDVKQQNPGLIYTRISGYGQTGPYSSKPGYASVTEAYSGFRYINGFDGEVPVRPNLSLGDSVAGLHAAMGILLALLARKSSESAAAGQVVDVALYESMFNLMEGIVPEYSGAGDVRQPAGSTITGIVPTNTYLCADHKHVVIGGNGDSIYVRLMTAIGRDDLINENESTHDRLSNHGDLAEVYRKTISDYCLAHTRDDIIDLMEAKGVPITPVLSPGEALHSENVKGRGLLDPVAFKDNPQVPHITNPLACTGLAAPTRGRAPALNGDAPAILADLGCQTDEIKAFMNKGEITS